MTAPDRPRADMRDALWAQVRLTRGTLDLDVELEAGPAEVVAVLGPNGAGKTTLLRALCGLHPLAAGVIRLGERVWDDPARGRFVPPEHRGVGVVFQDQRLFPHLDVRANVAFGPRAHGVTAAAAATLAERWLGRLGLADLAHCRPRELSGGQARRVALARALALDPRLLLMDEPSAGLDLPARLALRTLLRDPALPFAGPTVLVTHDPIEAVVVADRLVVLDAGRVAQIGTPAEVSRRPRTTYIARMVGLNLYAGRARSDSTGTVDVALDGGGELTGVDETTPVRVGDRVLVGVRPSAIVVHTACPQGTSTRNVWAARVVGLEPVGDRIRVQTEGPPSAVVDVTAAAVADLGLQPGRDVWLSAKATETEVWPAPDSPR